MPSFMLGLTYLVTAYPALDVVAVHVSFVAVVVRWVAVQCSAVQCSAVQCLKCTPVLIRPSYLDLPEAIDGCAPLICGGKE